ncbi:hypothetical protein LLB_0333 [Legionella longbeachae D-4968]|nr:hypothetical protein LLB_0333 [Legionella longbeachae D-4968]
MPLSNQILCAIYKRWNLKHKTKLLCKLVSKKQPKLKENYFFY